MKCLVTGATGFFGSHLVEALLSRGDDVTALIRREGAMLPTGIRTELTELSDRSDLLRAITRAAPDLVFHLAAQSYPTVSWRDPQGTFRANLTGTVALLEALRAWGGPAKVLIASSSAIYAASEKPIAEEGALGPASPYGVSKLAADSAAHLFGLRYGIPVVRVRPFFIIGPRKKDDVCADFARRFVAAEKCGKGEMTVGNLAIVRDFLDVRDGLAGLLQISEKGVAGEAYNLCSGRGYALSELLATFKHHARVTLRDVVDPALVRAVDEPVKVGNPAKLKALGWTPRFTLDESVANILAYWRSS